MKKNQQKDPFYQRELSKYANPIPSREFILQCLDELGKAVTLQKLITILGLQSDEAQEALRRRLAAMERDGQIMRNRRGSYALVSQLNLIRGRVVGHRDGFGFLIPDDKSEDIFLSPYQMRSLFPGDNILVRVAGVNPRGKREGVVVEVLERKTQQIVGRYCEEKNIAFVQPDNKDIYQDIVIPPGEQNGAKNGQFVVVEITTQPSTRRQPTGRVVEVLGNAAAPGLEVEIAIRAHNLPHLWPLAVQEEAELITAGAGKIELGDRKDVRDLPLVTIDGEDAKDFDDAVYCEPTSSGWKLYVAIADVSHYVKFDSALDNEAQRRGNSVYFPGKVIPMLPEVLSNDLCSLKPYVDRFCMICEMHISKQGILKNYVFYEALMRSRARLTYNEVFAMLEGKKKSNMALLPHLQDLYELYHVLRNQREKRGALDFETTETKIIFGKDKKIKEIVPVVRNDAHKIIEECMLIANVATAKFLARHKIPVLYRVHEGPNPEKLTALRDFLRSVGLKLTGGDEPEPMDYAKLIKQIQNRKDAHLIQTVLLRSLKQAVYAPEKGGHFGLAYEYYTHFTSPIRRYPDLLVHRALRHVLTSAKKDKFNYNEDDMIKLGEHCSMTERRADEATREAVDWLKCFYMQDKLGKTFSGIISGVTNFGVFVQLDNIYAEGLVHITALKNDYYLFDPAKHYLKGKRSGITYRLGDKINILVSRVDIDERQIDFEVV